MRRASFLLILALAALLRVGQAQVVFGPERIDLGELLQMDRREFELKVTNGGTRALRAAELGHDCGCLRILAGGGVDLAPGASLVLRFELNTDLLEGPQRQEIRWGAARFVLSFHVVPDFVLEPGTLQLGELGRGAVGEGSVIVRARPGLDAELVLLQAPPAVELRIEELERAPGAAAAWRIHLRREVAAAAPAGAFEELVLLEPRGARVPLLRIGLFGRVVGSVEPRPSVLDFGRLEPGETARVRLRLESRDGRPFRILGYRLLGRRVAGLEGVEAALAAEIDIEAELGDSPGAQRGMLELILDHPGERRLSVAWRARVIERKP